MNKITGITLATLGVLGVAGAVKWVKSAIRLYRYNNMQFSIPYESYYETLAKSMRETILIIKSSDTSSKAKLRAAELLKELLQECLTIRELDDLTAIYSDKPSSLIIGYDPVAVSQFVSKFYWNTGKLKPMTERKEVIKPAVTEDTEPETSEDEPFKQCFTCDCECECQQMPHPNQ